MPSARRAVLKTGAAAGLHPVLAALGLLPANPALAQQFSDTAFQAKSIVDALKALGASSPTDSAEVVITCPDIAENGALVPVAIRSGLPRTQTIALLVDKNPNPLAGGYELFEGMEPEVGMRIKMSQTSDVVAVVRADGRHYMARKEIKVTVGGCAV